MDYSKFLDDDFDVKEWVNGAFNAQKEGNKDQYATTLVMKLQMFIQEVNHVIDECCQQTVTNLPRVMRELDAVKQEASLLREQMQIVKNDIEKVEQDTSQSMQTLLKLDLVKSRMNDASAALQEADNWTTLSADVDVVFESQDVHAIAEKLVGLQHSLEMLTDVPDYADRCQFLETLKNRLEAVLSPQVVAAFSAQSVESAQMYAQVFSDMGRLPQLTKYYHKCHKGHLLQSWRSVVQSGGTNDDNLPEQLSLFYDQLMAMWHSQIKWCTQVFTDPAPIVVDLLTEVLNDLDPTSSSLISRHIESEHRPVAALIQLKQFSERFAKSMEGALETHSPSHLQLPSVQSLAVTIYAPYMPYIQKLGSFEESTLTAALNDIPLDHEEVFECTRLLADSVSKLFLAAKQANERCIQLSNGCGYVSLLEALQNYFLDYVREFRRVLTNVREKCHVDTSCMDAEDWSLFQNCLRIAQTSGDLILNTEEFQQQLLIDIVSCAEKYCPPSPTSPIASPTRGSGKKNPFHDYRLLLLDSDGDRATFDSLVTALEEGDMPSMPGDVKQEMYALSESVHKFAFDIVFAPLQQQLNLVSTMEVWVSETSGVAITANLPTFSLSPQEYITKIGQYLMTLPQQLDPFSLEDNPCLTAALRHSNLPYTSIQAESLESLADVWLESVARGTMHVYTEVILQIPQLTPHSTQQLITDIDYLVNVLDDLGLPSSDNIKDIVSLLKAPVASYQQTAEAAPRRLASVIAGMRSITLME